MFLRSIATAALSLSAGSVLAADMHVSFSGTVQFNSVGSPYPAVGTPLLGGFVFSDDPSTYTRQDAPGSPAPGWAGYAYSDAFYAQWLNTADGTTSAFPIAVEVFNDNPNGSPGLGLADTLTVSALRDSVLYRLVLSGPADSFSSNALPSSATLQSFWTAGVFAIQDRSQRFGAPWLQARIDQLSVSSPVPEPSAWAMTLAGGLGIGLFAARRGRKVLAA